MRVRSRSAVLAVALLAAVLLAGTGGISAGASPHLSPPPAPCNPPAPALRSSATPVLYAAVDRNPSDVGISLGFCSTITGVTGPYTLNWSFGDGTTSSLQDPVHVYQLPANYTVVLTLNSTTFNTTSTLVAEVYAAVTATAGYAPLAPTTASRVNFTVSAHLGVPPYAVFWSFGDGLTSTGLSALHTFLAPGTYTVQVWTNDSGGGSAYELFQVNVTAAPPSGGQATGNTDILVGTSLAAVAVALVGYGYFQWEKKRRPKFPTPGPPPGP